MDIIFLAACLYLAVYAGLFARGDGSNLNRPKLFTNWMIWLKERGYWYVRDHVFSSLFLTPLYSLPFLYYFGLPLWWGAVYAIGVLIGGLSGWREWFNFDESNDYREGVIRMSHYAALFIPLGLVSFNLFWGIIFTLVYALISPLAYWFRAKNMWFKNWTQYESQYAEGVNAALYATLSALVVL